MRKNLHHKIMLGVLAGSFALGFIYAQPALAEDVTIAHGADDGNGGTYNLDATYTPAGMQDGTDYGDENGYKPITLPQSDIDKFTVTAGNGSSPESNNYLGGNGGSIFLLAINNAINNGVSITAGNGSNITNTTDNNSVTPGNGGNVTLTFNNTVTGAITATAGSGGNVENKAQNLIIDTKHGTSTGSGGDVTLSFNNVVTDSITLTSGKNGTITENVTYDVDFAGTAFKGGSVNFTADTIQSADAGSALNITLTQNDGSLEFHTNTLNIQNNTVTITATGNIGKGQSQDNHIDNLILTGSGNFITNLSNNNNITVGRLSIDGGTVNSANWDNIIERNYTDPYAANITLGANGVTFDIDINDSKSLSKGLTGEGGLTKTGTGTLTLDGITNDYTGLTIVKEGALQAYFANLTKTKGLVLYGGVNFMANPNQNWEGKDFIVYDNGSDTSATYDGTLNAQNSNLYFIANGNNTNPLLNVMGNANISGSKYNIGFTGKTTFDEGQTLTLIEAGNIDASNLQKGDGFDGINIGSTITQNLTDVTTIPNITTEGYKLIATLGTAQATEEASVINGGTLGTLAFNLQGADLIAREGMDAAVRSADFDRNHAVFAALTRSDLDYDTVEVDGTNMLAGLAWRSTIGAGSLTYGVFAEHGDGSYDTYNSFNGSTLHGEADTDYTGGGILARMDFDGNAKGHSYVEASGRVGRADTDYTNSGLRDAAGRAASYSTESTYYGAHIGAGYMQNLDGHSNIDWYGKLLWTRLEGDTATLSTGERLTFDDADSLRLRVGGRYNYVASDYVSYYAGLAYEYEFDGEASGFTNGLALGDEDLTGGSGVAELGINFKPSKNSPFSLELNLTGFTGEREGFRGGVEAVYMF